MVELGDAWYLARTPWGMAREKNKWRDKDTTNTMSTRAVRWRKKCGTYCNVAPQIGLHEAEDGAAKQICKWVRR